jgi:hypothetical protein
MTRTVVCAVSCFLYCYAECHRAECHHAECHHAECHHAECHHAECHYAECHHAECHYNDCHGSDIKVSSVTVAPSIFNDSVKICCFIAQLSLPQATAFSYLPTYIVATLRLILRCHDS